MLKSLPAMWETRVRSLGQENPLEKEMATHWRMVAILQCLGNLIVGGACQARVNGVVKSPTQLSNKQKY